jgi:type 1 glutamine amidotransferase
MYRRPSYPVTWARLHGKGRVFYTALGHREDVWTNPAFQSLIVGAVKWATGVASASVKPDVARVTPGYATLAPPGPPKPAAPAAVAPAAAAPRN